MNPKVLLLGADLLSPDTLYTTDVSADGQFSLPRVLPGRYWAVVNVDSGSNSRWLTRKIAVDVDGNVSGLSLTLIQQ